MDTLTESLYDLLLLNFKDIEPIQKVPKGSILFQEHEKVTSIYLIISGSVALGRNHVNGKEFTLKIIMDKDILMEYQLFKNNPTYHFSARAFEDCELLIIPKDLFEAFIQSNINYLSVLTNWMSTRYLKAQMKCQDLIINGKKGGLYSVLIRLCHSFGKVTENGIVISIPLTHQELANLTYGTREVIQRMLKELKENDIIEYDRSRMIIKNINYLRKEVDCQHCPHEICGLN